MGDDCCLGGCGSASSSRCLSIAFVSCVVLRCPSGALHVTALLVCGVASGDDCFLEGGPDCGVVVSLCC